MCPCEIARIDQKQQELTQSEKVNKTKALFGQEQLGPKFRNATFENWVKLPGTQNAYQEAVGYVQERRWRKGEGLLFFGGTGNGKSHLAAAIFNELVPIGVAAIFKVMPDLLGKIQSTYGKNGRDVDESMIINTLCEADLVVLDDLGSERLTDWSLEKMFRIINSLYTNEKALIITTNCDIQKEFKEKVGARIYDRIIEMCRLVENNGDSYRIKIATARMKAIGE